MSKTITSPRLEHFSSSLESATLKTSILRNLEKEYFYFPPFLNPQLDLSFREKMGEIHTEIYAISEDYGLESHSICLFERAFRMFQRRNFSEFLENSQTESNLELFQLKLDFIDIYAIVCLRLVMKFAESQDPLYERTVFSEMWDQELLSPYDHILNDIVIKVI